MNDLISRQAVIKLIRESAEDFSKLVYGMVDPYDLAFKVGHLPSADPERKKPDHGYMWICPECGLEVHSDFSRCVRCGWDRPSAEPERKRGEWIDTGTHLKCSVCTEYLGASVRGCNGELYCTAFCPNCGADMRGEENE